MSDNYLEAKAVLNDVKLIIKIFQVSGGRWRCRHVHCRLCSALLKEAQPVGGERHQGQPGALNGCLFDSKIK